VNSFTDPDNEIMTYTMSSTAPFSTFTASTRTLTAASNVMNTVGSTLLVA